MNQGRFDQDNRSGRSGHFNHDDKRPWFGEGQRGSRQGSERSERYRSGSYEDESGYGQSSRGGYGGERGDRDFDDDRFGRSSTEFGDHSGSQGSRGGRGFQPGRGFQESGREFESGRHGGGSGSDAYQRGGYQTGGYQAGGYPSGGNQGGDYRSGGYQGSGYQSGGYPGGGYQGETFQGSEYQEGGSQSRGRSGGFGSPSDWSSTPWWTPTSG